MRSSKVEDVAVEVAARYGTVIAPERVCAPFTVRLPESVRSVPATPPVRVPPERPRYCEAVMPSGMSESVRPERPLTLELEIATPESLSMIWVRAMLLVAPPAE